MLDKACFSFYGSGRLCKPNPKKNQSSAAVRPRCSNYILFLQDSNDTIQSLHEKLRSGGTWRKQESRTHKYGHCRILTMPRPKSGSGSKDDVF